MVYSIYQYIYLADKHSKFRSVQLSLNQQTVNLPSEDPSLRARKRWEIRYKLESVCIHLVQQRVQHADAEDPASGKRQAEHESQVGALISLNLETEEREKKKKNTNTHAHKNDLRKKQTPSFSFPPNKHSILKLSEHSTVSWLGSFSSSRWPSPSSRAAHLLQLGQS